MIEGLSLFPPDQLTDLYWANLTAPDRVVINQGGTSSGKSYAIMQVLLTICCAKRGYTCTVVSDTIPKLKEDTMRIASELFSSSPALRRFSAGFNKSDRVYTFTTGSILEFKSFEDPEQAKGGKREILYINEATRLDYMTFFEANLRTYVRTFIDYNPSFSFWVHDRVLGNKAEYPSAKVIRSWHVHNPFLSDEVRASIEGIQDKELWKVYARGLTGRLAGNVYSWAAVDRWPDSGIERIVWGLDFGYTNDPTVLVKVAVMAQGGDFDYIVNECCYAPGIVTGHLHQILQANGYRDGEIIFCDHDREAVIQLRELDLAAVLAEKGEGSILNGVLFLKSRKIAYTSSSKNLAIELGKYKFVEVDGQPTNKVVDAYNHALDAVRYAIYTDRR